MSTYNLDLLFLDNPIFEDRSAHSQIAHVFIKSKSGCSYEGCGHLDLITPQCLSFVEFEAQIDRLKAELETLRKSARAKFGAADRPA